MRRLGQALVLLLMAMCAVGAGASIAVALYYHRFSTDVRTAVATLPATVDAVLSPTSGTLDEPQVTLVRGSSTPGSGGVVLFRTSPEGETTTFLSIPGSAVLAGEPVSRLSTPGLVRALRAMTGIGISHVAIIDLSNVSPEYERRDHAEQQVLRAIAGRALAPTSFTQLQATGRVIAQTGTDLTAADVLGLTWTRLDDRQVVQCAFAAHQTIDPAQGHAIAAAFVGREGGERVSSCRAHAVTPSAFVPPKAALVMVQQLGTWVFVVIAAAAMLMSLGAAALFARIRLGTATAAPVPRLDPVGPGPTLAVSLFASAAARPRLGSNVHQPAAAALTGAAGAVRRSRAGAAATVRASMASLARVGRTLSAESRVGLRLVIALRRRVSRWPGQGRRRAVALMGAGPPARSGYRSRVRRYVYLHQDAMWIGLCATVATGILIRLLSS